MYAVKNISIRNKLMFDPNILINFVFQLYGDVCIGWLYLYQL
jgi:hypothetical protein